MWGRMTHSILATLGLLSALVGVLLLFRYGMPYRVETKGIGYWELTGTDAQAIGAERLYRELGMLGLVPIIVGTALQIGAVWIG